MKSEKLQISIYRVYNWQMDQPPIQNQDPLTNNFMNKAACIVALSSITIRELKTCKSQQTWNIRKLNSSRTPNPVSQGQRQTL
jgi:hypothetical protein